jgi:hypothetical protein
VPDGEVETLAGKVGRRKRIFAQGEHTVVASTNKSLAQMNKSPGVGKATKRYRPEGDVGEAKNQHTSPTAAE